LPVERGPASDGTGIAENLQEALAATPLGQAYTPASAGTDSPFAAQFVAFAAGIHRWNVWRTYQGMKGEPT
jgi:hypothetical protein